MLSDLHLNRVLDDQHAHLLTPSFALSGNLPGQAPSYENMSPAELEAFLAEMEPDIRAADRDMREIEMLERKGVTGAGKLTGKFVNLPPHCFDSKPRRLRGLTATPKRAGEGIRRGL